MSKRYFLTGTDTDAGKTLVSRLLLLRASQLGHTCFGSKPVAAGCETIDGQLSNSDARILRRASQPSLDYALHNPITLEPPIAPHIAAEQCGTPLSVERLMQACQTSLEVDADVVLVEGAGGWLVPLNQQQTLADFAKALGYPVILVVGMKLGCINHALLTSQLIQQSGLKLAGWVANRVDPAMAAYDENMAYLNSWFEERHIPLLAEVPFTPGIDDIDDQDLQALAGQCQWPWQVK